MRLSLASAAVAAIGALSSACAASADEYGVAYFGLRGSLAFTESGSTTSSVSFDYNEEYAEGFGAALVIGWVVDENFRMEIEGGFRSADLKEVTIVRDDTLVTLPGDVIDVGGDAQAGTAMVNLYADMHEFEGGGVLPWIGFGLGAAFVDYSIDASVVDPMDPPNLIVLFDAKDETWVFAYQFMAGVTFPIGQSVSMTAAYRFFQTEDFVYVDVMGEEFETDLTQHSFDLGVNWHL